MNNHLSVHNDNENAEKNSDTEHPSEDGKSHCRIILHPAWSPCYIYTCQPSGWSTCIIIQCNDTTFHSVKGAMHGLYVIYTCIFEHILNNILYILYKVLQILHSYSIEESWFISIRVMANDWARYFTYLSAIDIPIMIDARVAKLVN